ncbi:MAG: hypothetical protein K8S16_01835 [Bacteroidales bacterium]|nr:hypothetical protein [Bacteroidales bacterium]
MKQQTKYIIFISTLLFSFLFSGSVCAQSNASIENIDFYAEGKNLVVKYDITKAQAGETFEIWAKVITASGKSIIPASVSGDIGKGVTGGPNKRIEWDVQADNADLSEEFHVEVYARSDQVKTKMPKPQKKGTGVGVGGAMLLSAILPGLGKTVVNRGGGHWMWGVIGYGCLAGTIVMNSNAYDAYENYKTATTPDERDDFFQQANDYDLYSKVFLGTAATIWIVDIITTGIYASKKRRRANKSNFSMNYSMDPLTGKPLVGFNYKF